DRKIVGKLAAQPFEHVVENPVRQKTLILTSREVRSKPANDRVRAVALFISEGSRWTLRFCRS
ncbi:MAG TPA: hypothetical protein P5330_05285, partial [Candidatus Competibacteraceae bacterium]|nr:hypothetical protein [Candidatus Competibacteraceae bacterium]